MTTRRRKPGSPKGVPKPKRWVLDPDFAYRVQEILPEEEVPQCARRTGIERATLHKYRSGQSKMIDALILFRLADDLKVSPRWLLTGRSGKSLLTKEEEELVSAFRASTEDEKEIFRRLKDRFSAERRE